MKVPNVLQEEYDKFRKTYSVLWLKLLTAKEGWPLNLNSLSFDKKQTNRKQTGRKLERKTHTNGIFAG